LRALAAQTRRATGRIGTDFRGHRMAEDATLDTLGLLCPLPVLKARKRLRSMQPGQVLRLLASDPAAVVDVPHFCAESGNELLGIEDASKDAGEGARAYLIRRT
jgi:tRNA 2-thiouridine synthesizing protein A